MTALPEAHAALREQGCCIVPAGLLGLPPEQDVIAALSPALTPDPRGHGKQHARDVITWQGGVVSEAGSIAHTDGTDDFSRFWLTADPRTAGAARVMPDLLADGRESGRMSADYFRYSPGTESPAHQDGFGDLVAIWVLSRSGAGAENFLITHGGRDVIRLELAAGMVLAFRDHMFLHGVTPLASGQRDALIFITLKDAS